VLEKERQRAKKALLDKPSLYSEIEVKDSRPPVPAISTGSKTGPREITSTREELEQLQDSKL
jgi:hypothetical protein